LLLSLFLASACGFHPVHAKTDSNLAAQLAAVQISDISSSYRTRTGTNTAEREAQVLKYKLAELLSPDGYGSYPAYRLDTSLAVEKSELGIQEDLRVTRYDIIETVDYKLVSLANNQIINEGKVRIKSSFNRTSSEFSTFVAEEDASEKAAEELAQEIKQRLTAFFAR
jgi:hypothetical protein